MTKSDSACKVDSFSRPFDGTISYSKSSTTRLPAFSCISASSTVTSTASASSLSVLPSGIDSNGVAAAAAAAASVPAYGQQHPHYAAKRACWNLRQQQQQQYQHQQQQLMQARQRRLSRSDLLPCNIGTRQGDAPLVLMRKTSVQTESLVRDKNRLNLSPTVRSAEIKSMAGPAPSKVQVEPES
ncbi:unnamed protein product [Protopolystoma xenopodis]|uniref:Uncharacterized protein n=1 Tax=Protopolystoma xenopodis TaxID=117903 RepID=A0A3S5CKT0_9PLAT|nr:unnamed protein product [Protopolystoma xenopodis]